MEKIIIIFMVISCLAGCSEKRDVTFPESGIAETPDKFTQGILEEQNAETDISDQEELSEVLEREEITIDYPFDDPEAYALTLTKLPDSTDEYELMLYGKDEEVLQQIPCGKLEEPIEFSYDGLRYGYYHDLEIFSSGSDTGLLFLWENERFTGEAIEIPRYTEVRNYAMLTTEKEGDKLQKKIYLLNEEKRQTVEIRDYCLDLDTGWLEIQDCLENKSLFEGNAGLDEEGNPENSEYYEMLLWDDLSLSRPWNLEEQSWLPVWVGEKTEEASGTDSFDNSDHTQEYKDRQELLEEFGFADGELCMVSYSTCCRKRNGKNRTNIC